MTFDDIMKSRAPANERTAVFKEFVAICERGIDDDNLSVNERERYDELYSKIHSALYYMQIQLTQVDEWLEKEEIIKGNDRNQDRIDKLRNIRDALPYSQSRWHGEKND